VAAGKQPLQPLQTINQLSRGSFRDGAERLRELAVRLIQINEQGRQNTLEAEGSGYRDCKWYDGPPVLGIKNEIGAILAQYNLRGFQIEDWDVYEAEGSSSQISKTALLEAGVDASVIERCMLKTPWTAIVAKRRGTGRRNG